MTDLPSHSRVILKPTSWSVRTRLPLVVAAFLQFFSDPVPAGKNEVDYLVVGRLPLLRLKVFVGLEALSPELV